MELLFLPGQDLEQARIIKLQVDGPDSTFVLSAEDNISTPNPVPNELCDFYVTPEIMAQVTTGRIKLIVEPIPSLIPGATAFSFKTIPVNQLTADTPIPSARSNEFK